MDEPLGALDKNLREEMQEEIKRLRAVLGATVLYVTHDQQEAASMADRIAIMRAGRVEQVGSPRELYERPRTLFVAGFLGEATILPVAEAVAGGGEAVVARTTGGLTVRATAAGSGPAAGGPSAVCVRPESVILGPEACGADNHFAGVVEDVVFTAGSIRYRVRLREGGGALVTTRTPSRPGTDLLAAGAAVEVGWSSRDALLVPEG